MAAHSESHVTRDDRRAGRSSDLSEEERAYYALNSRVWRMLAPFYDAIFFVLCPFPNLRHEVVRRAGLAPGSRILDVATGTGAQALAFAPTAKEVVGIDLSEAMVRVARRKNRFANVTFQQADAVSLPFDDRSFDAACISFALHEMPSRVRERVLREMARVTRPGGRVVVVDYSLPRARIARAVVYQFVKLYEREHYESFVKLDLEALLERAGIVSTKVHSMLGGLARIVVGSRA